MKLTISIGWTIMQDKRRRIGAGVPQFFIDIDILPLLQNLWLFGWQASPHGKIGAWQENGVFIAHGWATFFKTLVGLTIGDSGLGLSLRAD